MRRNEDQELQIRLVELQIKHQHIASFFTVLISISASLTFSLFIGYLTIGKTTGEQSWIINAFTIMIAGGIMLYLFYHVYSKRIEKLKREIQELKKNYVW